MKTNKKSDYYADSDFEGAKPVPTLRGWPGIGVALRLHRDPTKFFSKTVSRYGDRVALRVFGRHVLLLTNPADVETVLIQSAADFGRSTEVKALGAVFGDGIYSSEGEHWRKQRRLVQPAFHHDRTMKYSSTMVEHMAARVDKWQHGQTLDILEEMSKFASDVICDVIFGPQSPDARAVASSVSTIFESLRAEVLYLSLWRKLPFPRNRRWNRAIATLDNTINHAIAERRWGTVERDDLLGIFLGAKDESGDGLSDEGVHDEVITLFVTGQETTAVALSWAVALLAQHSECQEEAAAETAHLTNGREVKAEDYPRLKFLNAIVQETLRLYPPLWSLGRSAIRDTMVGDLPVRKGTDVWIPIRQIHRDARWFSEPDRFNPYRWNNGVQRPTFSYLPFGGGQRSCVAQHFAMAEVVLGLAVMLLRFRFALAPGVHLEPDPWLTLRPKKRMSVFAHAR